jgi:NodT family efflux transporter outer membrane factor (OMF) lipoprotein
MPASSVHRRPSARSIAAAIGLFACASGIVVGTSSCENFRTRTVGEFTGAFRSELPEDWASSKISVPASAATGWIDSFGNSRLKTLAREAAGKNYDLAASAARVRAAEQRARIAGSDRRPQFAFDTSAARSQTLRGAQFQSVRSDNYNLGLDLTWEIDLWGRIANLQAAAIAELDATSADYQAARLSLAANVVKSTLDLWEAEQQVTLSERNLASLRTNLDILDDKLEAGDADDRTALEISLSRADVARSEATIAQQGRQADAARRQLETLLGRYPSGTVSGIKDFPKLGRSVPAGLPSELLLRRPDIIAAERRIDAELNEIAASRKELLPSVRLTAGSGTSTTQDFVKLFDVDNLVYNIGSTLAQQITEGGRLRGNIRLNEAERDQLVADYAETVLQAFREIETALAAEKYFADQQRHLSTATTEAERAEELSLSQYQRGLVDIITVLESQRRAFDARSNLLSLLNERAQNRVDLHLALGGDFDHPPSTK